MITNTRRSFPDNYRALVAAFLLLFISVTASAQYDSTKVLQDQNAYGFNWKNGAFRYSFRIPTGDTLTMAVADSGSIRFYDGAGYLWNGYSWQSLGGSGSTNTSIGSAYKIAVNGSNDIKSLSAGWGAILDSATSGQVGVTVDSNDIKTVMDGNYWKNTGNTLTVAGTNFIGTTDSVDLVIKANNTEQLRFKANGDWALPKSTTIQEGGFGFNIQTANTLFHLSNKRLHFIEDGGSLMDIDFDANAPGMTMLIGDPQSGFTASVNYASVTSPLLVELGDISGGGYNGQINISDKIQINPPSGDLRIDTLNNETSQNKIIGWTSTTGADRGKAGYINVGSGLSLSGGELTATGSGTVNSGTQYRLGYYATAGTAISEAAAITANRALISDVNGVPTHSAVTATQLGYVDATSSIQTQIDGKISASSTNTLTNKRWTARVGSTTSSGTPTINTDDYDIYKLTAQAADITSFTTNLSGTPVDGDILEIQITGTAARAITWGASFVSSTVTLPATTVTTATLTVILQYYTTSSYGNNKWVCVNSF